MCNQDLEQLRLCSAMLLAQAVKRQFEGVKLGTGALTANGFYYDFDFPSPPSEEDLAAIEEVMKRTALEQKSALWTKHSAASAIRFFEQRGESWKVEWLEQQAQSQDVLVYEQGEFADIWFGCPAALDLIAIPAFKLVSVSGAYWQGDSSRPVLQRIYGVAFASQKELEDYLAWQEEAQKRDHRKLGKQLELFMFAEEAPGMPFYLPKGTVVRNELEKLSREYLKEYGYEEVRTPFLMNRQLWEHSGHWEHYHENMYFSELDQQHYALKPMNCPGHMLLYKNKQHSYRELPIRLAEFGQVHRHEFSGALNGLLRVRTFCQDDAHIFVRPDQVEEEVRRAIELIRAVYRKFGFDFTLELSTRPADSMGSDEQWEAAEGALRRVLEASGLPYSLNPGDGAFYGPKIDFHIKDALDRSHQCGTIQLDFQMPEKFGLSYVDEQNMKRTPIVIHRAVYGSIDRFMGILIEHYAGAFPLWLAPVQTVVIPVSEAHAAYADEVVRKLQECGIRAEADGRNEKLGYRVREAQLQKVPYIAVVGDAEAGARSVQVRAFGSKNQVQRDLDSFAAELQELIRAREWKLGV